MGQPVCSFVTSSKQATASFKIIATFYEHCTQYNTSNKTTTYQIREDHQVRTKLLLKLEDGQCQQDIYYSNNLEAILQLVRRLPCIYNIQLSEKCIFSCFFEKITVKPFFLHVGRGNSEGTNEKPLCSVVGLLFCDLHLN